jgi:hypothetical protein
LSPIFTRPYREQHEHDRIIRLLQARYRRKHEVVINPGPDQQGSVTVGELPVYPDLLLYSQEPTHHLEATVEVETGESVHLLEARAEWGVFSQVPVPFILYVPTPMLETARRIIDEQQWVVSEIWTYLPGMDQLRFVQVFKHPNPPVVVPPKVSGRPKAKPAATSTPAPASKAPAAARASGDATSRTTAAVSGKPAAAKGAGTSAAPAGKMTSAKSVGKPAPKVPPKAPAKPATTASGKGSASTSKAATKAPAAKPTAGGKKVTAPARPAVATKKAAGARKGSAATKASAPAKKAAGAGGRSTPAKASSGRRAATAKHTPAGKAARRR